MTSGPLPKIPFMGKGGGSCIFEVPSESILLSFAGLQRDVKSAQATL